MFDKLSERKRERLNLALKIWLWKPKVKGLKEEAGKKAKDKMTKCGWQMKRVNKCVEEGSLNGLNIFQPIEPVQSWLFFPVNVWQDVASYLNEEIKMIETWLELEHDGPVTITRVHLYYLIWIASNSHPFLSDTWLSEVFRLLTAAKWDGGTHKWQSQRNSSTRRQRKLHEGTLW